MGNVREYDGVDDATTFSGYASRTGPVTYAALLNRNDDAEFAGIVFGYTSGAVAQHGLMLLDSASGSHVAFGATSSSSEHNTISLIPGTDDWSIVVASHPGGSGTARLHKKPLVGGSWQHQEGTSSITIASTGASGTLRLGCAAAADFFYDGNLAVVAAWSKELSDGEVEALSVGSATQAWYDAATSDLLFLADINQASTATAITDLSAGGLTQSAQTGTVVRTDDDPTGWTFGVSAGGASQVILPDADTTTTGWTTTPLFSKINDASDGTVITGALS